MRRHIALMLLLIALSGCAASFTTKAKDFLWEKKTELGLKGKERRFAVADASDAEAAAVERDAVYIKKCLAEQKDADGNPAKPSYTCESLLPTALAGASAGLKVTADELRKQREIYEVLLDPLIGVFSLFARSEAEARTYAMHWHAVQLAFLPGGEAQ